MKKASKIILIIAGVFGVISITAAVIFAVIFFIAPSVPELQAAIADGLQYAMDQGLEEQYYEMLEWAADNLAIFTGIVGGSLLGNAFLTLLSTIFCFVSAGADKKPLYVIDIILGFFCSSLLQLIGGILGLISGGKKEEQPKPVEAAPKEEPVIVAPPVEEGVAISDDEAELVTTEDLSPVTKKEQKQIDKAEAATYEEQEPEIQKEVKEEIKNEPVKKAAPKKAAPKKAPAAKKE